MDGGKSSKKKPAMNTLQILYQDDGLVAVDFRVVRIFCGSVFSKVRKRELTPPSRHPPPTEGISQPLEKS